MENKKDTVCAVVVTYNRKNFLMKCLEALLKQTRPLDAIYLIDNASTDGTPKLLLEKEYIKELPPENLTEPWEKEFEIKNLTDGEIIKLHYVRMHENTGGAGGFYEGVKRSYEKGYDWLWLMDDDGLPEDKALSILIQFSMRGYKVLNSLVVNKENPEELAFCYPLFDKRRFLRGYQFTHNRNEIKKRSINGLYPYQCFFNGTLIKRNIISLVGFPKKELFIRGDEVDYVRRIKKITSIVTVLDSIHYHPLGDLSDRWKYSWKRYYRFRNDLYLAVMYEKRKVFRVIYLLIVNFLIFSKSMKFREYFRAIYDFFKLIKNS